VVSLAIGTPNWRTLEVTLVLMVAPICSDKSHRGGSATSESLGCGRLSGGGSADVAPLRRW
jgi:hypothetical protein